VKLQVDQLCLALEDRNACLKKAHDELDEEKRWIFGQNMPNLMFLRENRAIYYFQWVFSLKNDKNLDDVKIYNFGLKKLQ